MTRSEDRRRAVQGAWPRAVPLTRRERAAMELALEVLRERNAYAALSSATQALAFCRDVSLYRALVSTDRPGWYAKDARTLRLIRARLALYLRARLRADRGDCGPRVGECEACGGEGEFWDANVGGLQCWTCDTCDGHGLRGRITPLWERASR